MAAPLFWPGFVRKIASNSFHRCLLKGSKQRHASSSSAALQINSNGEDRWQLWGGLCLIRYPIITPEKNEFENEYDQLLNKMEAENCLLSDHELQHIQDEKNAKVDASKVSMGTTNETVQEVTVKLAKDLEVEWETERKQFTPNPRISDDDRSNNLKSLKRAYANSLYLIVQEMVGDKPIWGLPKSLWQENQSMREVAEGIVPHIFSSSNLDLSFFGNAPNGFLKYAYPPESVPGYAGGKVFYYKAQVRGGSSLTPNKEKVLDYAWVTRDQLLNYLDPRECRAIDKFSPEL